MSADTSKLGEEFLEHYGILGMKWGIRKSNAERAADARARRRKEKRAANTRGELRSSKKNSKKTSSDGKEESGDKGSSGTSKSKRRSGGESEKKDDPKLLSTKELQEKVNRLNLEKQLKNLSSSENTKKKNIGIQYIESLPDIALRVAQNQTEKTGNKVLGGYIDNALAAKGIPVQKEKKK